MENSVIAVQVANGTFVPVLNTSSKKRRRLVVTTVRDNQDNVKIELFRGSDESMSDPEYVGSLTIENVEPSEKGGPDISVLLGVDESGNLNATARDAQSGEYQSLSVSLDQLEEQGGYDVPDFQLSDEELTLDDLSLDEEPSLEEEPSMDEEPSMEEEPSLEELESWAEEEAASEQGAEPEPMDEEPAVAEPAAEEPSAEEPSGEAPAAEAAEEPETADLGALEDDALGDLSFEDFSMEEESAEEAEGALGDLGDLSDLEPSFEEEAGSAEEESLPEDLTAQEPAAAEPAAAEPAAAEPAAEEQPAEELEPEDLFGEEAGAEELGGEEAAPGGEDEELEELSLDDISFDEDVAGLDLEGELETEEPADEPAAAPAGEDELEAAEELEDVSLDEIEAPSESEEPLADFSEEGFSFDESFSQEEPSQEEPSQQELGDEDREPGEPDLELGDQDLEPGDEDLELGDLGDLGDLGEDEDFDLGSLTQEEGGEEAGEPVGAGAETPETDQLDTTGLDEGMVEADLGDEDFTFDEGVEDEPLFPDAAATAESLPESPADEEELEDTLSPEEFDRLDSQPIPETEAPDEEEAPLAPRRSNAIIFVGYMILALAALGVLTYLVFRLMEGPPAPPLRATESGYFASALAALGLPGLFGKG